MTHQCWNPARQFLTLSSAHILLQEICCNCSMASLERTTLHNATKGTKKNACCVVIFELWCSKSVKRRLRAQSGTLSKCELCFTEPETCNTQTERPIDTVDFRRQVWDGGNLFGQLSSLASPGPSNGLLPAEFTIAVSFLASRRVSRIQCFSYKSSKVAYFIC